MNDLGDLVKQLRARVDASSTRKSSLDWQAADAIEVLQARVAELELETGRLQGAITAPATESDGHVPPSQPEPSADVLAAPSARALSLQEAADVLGLSYGTVFENRRKWGFTQVGRQWRIWPDVFREILKSRAAPQERRSYRVDGTLPRDSVSLGVVNRRDHTKRVGRELDELLRPAIERRRKHLKPSGK